METATEKRRGQGSDKEIKSKPDWCGEEKEKCGTGNGGRAEERAAI